MFRRVVSGVVALFAVAVFVSVADAGEARNRYIVVLKKSVSEPGNVAAKHEREHDAKVDHVYRHALKGYSAALSRRRLAALRADERVARVEADATVTATAQTVPTGVNRIQGALNDTANIDGLDDRVDADIAIVDSGVDLDHPDLNVVASADCVASGVGAGCGPGGDDDNGHGTHVAGVAAAKDNSLGVVGVAPGARLHAVKVLDGSGAGSMSSVIAGADWVRARASAIDVVNISLGGSGYSFAGHTAVQSLVEAGVVVVTSAGNGRKDVYGADGVFGTSDDVQPAAFPESMTVSALADFDGRRGGLNDVAYQLRDCTEDKDDSFACFSNHSNFVVGGHPVASPGKAIDLVLPGVAIYSTYKDAGYATASGTSAAAPHGAGLVALRVAARGRASDARGVYRIRQALVDAGQPMSGINGFTRLDDPDSNHENVGWALRDVVLTARHSGKVLDVAGVSRDNGARVHQWDWWGGPNQKWRLEDVGGGYFKVVSANSGKVLDVAGVSRDNGAPVHQWDWWAGWNQHWRMSGAL